MVLTVCSKPNKRWVLFRIFSETGAARMRRFTFAPSFTVRGRPFKGLRGWGGKPLHPPLTDIPIGAYVIAAGFDASSIIAGGGHGIAQELFDAAGWATLAGAIVSVFAILTGWADWHRSSSPGTQARRTINAHAITMIAGSVLVLVDIALRYTAASSSTSSPVYLVVVSVLVAVVIGSGATIGGTMVFDYGFNVETAGDSPVWYETEVDVRPGDKAAADVAATH
jgi:uncharacterized membrane protein